jgi:dTDP-4-amino-4,6-dideoxygalactose transaminase
MNELVDLCNEHNIKLIEDCAQSFGSSYGGKKLGSFGYASCHSFYPTKNLGAIGDAGAICTNDLNFINKLKYFRNLGSIKKYIHDVKGTNSRLDSLQCCFLLTKLPYLDTTISYKQTIAGLYSENINFKHLKNKDSQVDHSYHLYVIIVENRDEFVDFMNTNNIETIVHYPVPFYKSQAFTEINHLTFKNTEYLSRHIVSIPIYPTLTEQQVQKIILIVNSFNKHETFDGTV